MSKSSIARMKQEAARFAGRPVDYALSWLRVGLTQQQAHILQLLEEPPYRVLVRSANNQGKTFVGAVKAAHHFDTWNPGISIITSETGKQVKDLSFRELRKIYPAKHLFLPKATRLEDGSDHFVDGYTSATPDGFQGRHDEHLGLWFDEATGIDIEYWYRGATMFGGHVGHWWLATYNPNDPSSPAFAQEESGGWHVVELSALDHPNILHELAGLPPPFPGAVRLASVVSRIATECDPVKEGDIVPATDFEFPKGSGVWFRPRTMAFEAQILGRWPIAASESIWTPLLFDSLQKHDINPAWGLAGGMDVARFGDDESSIAIRKGPCLIHLEGQQHRRIPELLHRIRQLLTYYAQSQDYAKRVPVYVDDTGGYGTGIIDYKADWNFIGINAASESPNPQYPNMRSFLWFNGRALADAGVFDPHHLDHETKRKLKLELTSPHYHIDNKGRRVAEIKSQIKKRLGRSPDLADAVNLCYF